MKRRLPFLVAAIVTATVHIFSQSASAQNKVLFEEFTSSTCPPCSLEEPFMLQSLIDKHDEITILRWHQNFPQPGDPSFVANPDGQNRLNYYGVLGIPDIVINGNVNSNAVFSQFYSTSPIEDSISSALAAMKNYYTMSVAQSIVGDSIIAVVTVTTGATAPPETDLRICAVVGERFIQYEGYNGVPAHVYVARASIPALTSTGSLPTSASFTQAVNTTQKYRFATLIKSAWNRKQLMIVSFIQSAGVPGNSTKPVYQSAWTENLNLDIEPVNNDGFIADGTATDDFTISNNSATPATVVLSLSNPPSVAPITLGLKGAGLDANNVITIPANGSKIVSITGITPGKYTGSGLFGLMASTVDSIGVGGHPAMVIGNDIHTLILDVGAGSEGSVPTQGAPQLLQKSLSNLGIPSAFSMGGLISGDYTAAFNNDWSHFQTVVLSGGNYYPGFLSTNDINYTNALTLLQGGGNFLMQDAYLPYYFEGQSDPSYTTAFEDMFHCDTLNSYAGTGSWKTLDGTTDFVGAGVATTVTTEPYATSLVSMDSHCKPIFVDNNGDTVGVRAPSLGGKAVYLAFDIGQVNIKARDTVTKRIFNWFNGTSAVATNIAPTEASSFSASPNPFSATTNIRYVAAGNESNVQMSVFDILGREVAKLTPQRSGANTFSATIEGATLAAGSYHVVVRSAQGTHSLPVMITR